jgi:hypothetical protein
VSKIAKELAARNSVVTLLLGLFGIGLMLSSLLFYMRILEYPVITRSVGNNGLVGVNITYVDSLSSLFPIVLALGLFLSIRGFWHSRNLLVTNRGKVRSVFLLGCVFTLLSLLNMHYVNSVDYSAYELGFPLPWLLYLNQGITQVNMLMPTVWLIFVFPFWLAVSSVSMLLLWKLKKIEEQY